MFKQNTDEMSKSVSDIAKEFSFNRYSFSEAFEIPYSEKETINKLSECGICTNIEEMRENLEYAGKRCTLKNHGDSNSLPRTIEQETETL